MRLIEFRDGPTSDDCGKNFGTYVLSRSTFSEKFSKFFMLKFSWYMLTYLVTDASDHKTNAIFVISDSENP